MRYYYGIQYPTLRLMPFYQSALGQHEKCEHFYRAFKAIPYQKPVDGYYDQKS
jgi:hypothetical protein